MTIRRNIEDVPRLDPDKGLVPSRNPFFVTALAEQWGQLNAAEREQFVRDPIFDEAGPYRQSYTSRRCDRQLHYDLLKVEGEPPDLASLWAMGLGSRVHELLGPAVEAAYPDARHEVVTDLRPVGLPGAGYTDMVSDELDLVAEYKTINGYAFKMIATSFRGPAEGPKYGHVLQGALGMRAHGKSKLVVGYLGMENVSPDMADTALGVTGRFAAEWHFTKDELDPLIDREVQRVDRLIRVQEAGLLPAREIHDPGFPAGAVVQSPSAKAKDTLWTVRDGDDVRESGRYWGCAYCPHLKRCLEDGPGDEGVEVDF